jgi:hypothetical protein
MKRMTLSAINVGEQEHKKEKILSGVNVGEQGTK